MTPNEEQAALEVRVASKVRIKAKRFPKEAFFAVLFDSRHTHILFSLHREYKGFRRVHCIYKNVKRIYLGYLEIEYTKVY